MTRSEQAAEALALDLGTTRVKLAALDGRGALRVLHTADAPPPAGAGLVREVNAEDYRAVVEAALAQARAPAGTPLGLASQRSSFLVWERAGGRALTPLISWQDRRAADWCAGHLWREPRVRALTGLPLSPHYLGPKLAVLLAQHRDLRSGLAAGELCAGTLESWLVHGWSGRHESDLSMAARTLLVDVRAGDWSDELLELCGVPRAGLAAIVDSAGRDVALAGGLRLTASLADQPAGLLAALGDDDDAALVNLGTGGFVLRPRSGEFAPRPGYLLGPVARLAGRVRFALEGTINGGGATVDALAPGPTELPTRDEAPQAFCLPDENGVGAPFWRPDVGFTFSAAARALPATDQRRIALEGLVFRVAGILDELAQEAPLARVVLSGGLARDGFVRAALATSIGVPLELYEQPEATLLGAARLAAGVASEASARGAVLAASPQLAWLPAKRAAWRAWLEALLER